MKRYYQFVSNDEVDAIRKKTEMVVGSLAQLETPIRNGGYAGKLLEKWEFTGMNTII
ncbi:hypothetical protein ACLBOM_33165 [Escherichia coli]